jgi:hypothetical protein
MVLPSGQTVAVAPSVQDTSQPPASQTTSHDAALLQSTLQAPVHSMAHPPALLQSTVEPAPTTARQVPASELQSSWQSAPQLAPQLAAELQSTLQPSRQAPTHDRVLLLQSTLHEAAAPQSTAQGEPGSH